MSQILTVTRIPEEKFRRFSRFPYVAAIKIDERYNNVYAQSGNKKQNKKSKIKVLNNPVCKTKNPVVTFDWQEKTDLMFDSNMLLLPEKGVVGKHLDLAEALPDDEKSVKDKALYHTDNSFLKLNEMYLAQSRENENKCTELKEIEKLKKTKPCASEWCPVTYELPKAPADRKNNSPVPASEEDALKCGKTVTSAKENLLNNADRDGTKDGSEWIEILNEKDTGHSLYRQVDNRQNETKYVKEIASETEKDKIVKAKAKEKPVGLVRNTRFGANDKITAYRPSTTIDNFRRKRLDVINENSVNGLDLEEGHKIWTEVDTIVHSSKNKHKRMKELLNTQDFLVKEKNISSLGVSVDTNQNNDRTNPLHNAIELRPKTESGNKNVTGSTKERIWSNETDIVKKMTNEKVGKIGRGHRNSGIKPASVETRFRRFKHENFVVAGDINNNDFGRLAVEDHAKCCKISKLELDAVEDVDFLVDQNAFCDANQKSWDGNIILIYPGSGQCNFTGPLIHLPIDGACKGRKVTMATTLPRITPVCTPLPTGITQPPPRSHSSASMYVPYPPKELSSTFDYLRIPGRINPLAPPPPRKRINWSWETTDQHYENEKRSLLMQKREHTRYHSAWSKAFYGAPAEKEAYRRHFREVLKQQMADKSTMEKMEFREKIRETEQAISYDRDCRMNDAKEYHRKHAYLMQYRDGNKKQMEERWAQNRYSRELENRIDRERLKYNPINWSCSLK